MEAATSWVVVPQPLAPLQRPPESKPIAGHARQFLSLQHTALGFGASILEPATAAGGFLGFLLAGRAARAATNRRRSRCGRAVVFVTRNAIVEDAFEYAAKMPEGGDARVITEEDKKAMNRIYYENMAEIDTEQDTSPRPSGDSGDPDNLYFWKMSRDKHTIDVIYPIPEEVQKKDIIYRLGEDTMDGKRGPTLEMGYRYKDEDGREKEKLVLDGQILNTISRRETYWTIDEMGGVRVCVLTLFRPTMVRNRYDPLTQKPRQELRIEQQTWDAILLQERFQPVPTTTVYFDISLEGEPAGRIEFGLFGTEMPKTVKNFVGLVTGEYEDDNGEIQKSSWCLKGNKFHNIYKDFILAAGNPGKDMETVQFTPEELKEYMPLYDDFSMVPKKVGKVEANWVIRWGEDLGLPYDEEGFRSRPGDSIDGNSDSQLQIIREVLKDLDQKGKGAKFIFFKREWERGMDIHGGTFPAESFKIPHAKRGMLTMDRNVEEDVQGSIFFITMKEFPEMDKKWVCFGEVTSGMELLAKIEEEYEFSPKQVVIEDCGVLS